MFVVLSEVALKFYLETNTNFKLYTGLQFFFSFVQLVFPTKYYVISFPAMEVAYSLVFLM